MTRFLRVALIAAVNGSFGCTGVKTYLDKELPPPLPDPLMQRASSKKPSDKFPGPVQPASAENLPALPATVPTVVDEFVRLAVTQNPRLARATIAIDAAQGHQIQAGLYPNPDLAITWDEIGDRTGNGILYAPKITQTIVTGKKLQLSQLVATRAVDQATLELIAERYAVVGLVRAGFYETLALQQRIEILAELSKLAEDAAKSGSTLFENKRIARLDLIQLEVERERFRAERDAAGKELPAAYRRLAAATGNNSLSVDTVAGSLDGLPVYDLEQVRAAVFATHPELRSAKVAVDRAQAAVRRAEVEPIPNVSVYAAFIRQYENKSYDGAAGVSMPIPVWNWNQGNIRTAKAELGMAVQNVGKVENELALRVATMFQTYAAARERAERFRREILPRAEETYKLSLEAFKGGQFEYLRVIAAQRAIAEARLELNKSLSEAWKSAAELSGMLLEEAWPGPVGPPKPPLEEKK
ncbi:MAG: TolC family protein [Planctomycetes bacterium]|nr:TolC family protein [Planctomycetota bacterium]